MAPQDWDATSDINLDLIRDSRAFSYAQVMRLLRLMQRMAASSGDTVEIRTRPKLSLAFPVSDVDTIEEDLSDQASRYTIIATFLGLYGSSSPLPVFYTEDLFFDDEGNAQEESVVRSFLDVINQRVYDLLFLCWKKYRLFLNVVEDGDASTLDICCGLFGIGDQTPRQYLSDNYDDCQIKDYELLRYIGLFTQMPRSAMGLRTLLGDALNHVPIEVMTCVLSHAEIPEDELLKVGEAPLGLGVNTYVGSFVEDRMHRFRLVVGPLNRDQFHQFLPGTRSFKQIVFLTRLYILEPLDFEVVVKLAAGEAETPCLGGPSWTRVGMDTWAFSGAELGEVQVTFNPN